MTQRLHIWSLDRMLVCVPASVPDSTIDSLDRVLTASPSVDGVLGVLTSGGLGSTPPFLCSEVRPGGVRVLIRGDLQAVAHGDGLSVPLSSGRAETWNDDVIVDITSISFDVGGADDGATVRWVAGRPSNAAATDTDVADDTAVTAVVGRSGDTVPVPTAGPFDEAADAGSAEVDAIDKRTLLEPEFLHLVADVDPEATLDPTAHLSAFTPDPATDPEPEPESASEPEDREDPDLAQGTPPDEAAALEQTATPAPTGVPQPTATPEPKSPPPATTSAEEEAPADPAMASADEVPPPDPATASGLDFSDLLDDTRAPILDSGPHPATAPAATPAPDPLPPPTGTPAPLLVPAEATATYEVAPSDASPSEPWISQVPESPPLAELAPATDAAAPSDPVLSEPVLSEPVPNDPASSGLGDHDGHTMTLSDLQRLREQVAASSPDVMATAAADTPRANEVTAVLCPYGHASPTTATVCRVCGTAIADPTARVVPRPTLARLVFDSGLVVDVDRPQLIGRKPTAPSDVDEIPNLVTLASPDSDISRLHTRVRIEGWDLLVEDVGSTNGTEIKLPNQDSVRIREHDPILVVPGTEVTIANAVRFRVDPPAP